MSDVEQVLTGGLAGANQIVRVPSNVSVLAPMVLKVQDLVISVPNLEIMESKLRVHLSKLYSMEENYTKIVQRQLLIGTCV